MASAAEIAETETEIVELTNQFAAVDKKEEEQKKEQEQEQEKKEKAFELSDSEDEEEQEEMEIKLAQMRADIAANDQAIKDLHLRVVESVDAEMAAVRAQLELTEASVGAEEQATILACPDEGTGSSSLSSTLRSESLSEIPPKSFSPVSRYTTIRPRSDAGADSGRRGSASHANRDLWIARGARG